MIAQKLKEKSMIRMRTFRTLFAAGSSPSSQETDSGTPTMAEEYTQGSLEEALNYASYVEFFFEIILKPWNEKYSSLLSEDETPVLEKEINFERWTREISDLCRFSYTVLRGDGHTQWENLIKIKKQFGAFTQLNLKVKRQAIQASDEFIEAVKYFSIMTMIIALVLEVIQHEVENNKRLQEELGVESSIDTVQDSISKMYVSPQKKKLESHAAQVRKDISQCSALIYDIERQIDAELLLKEEERHPRKLEDLVRQLGFARASLDADQQEMQKIISEAAVYNEAKEQLERLERKKNKIAGDNLREARNGQAIRFQRSRGKGIELIKNNANLFMQIQFSEFFINSELAPISSAMVHEYLNDCSSGMTNERKVLLLTYIKLRQRDLALKGMIDEEGCITQLSLRDKQNQMMYGFVMDIFSPSMKANELFSIESFGEGILNSTDLLAQQCVRMIQEHAERQKAIRCLKVDLDKVLSELPSMKAHGKKYQKEMLNKNRIGEQLLALDEEDQAVSSQIFFIKYAVQKALFKRGIFNDVGPEQKSLEHWGLDNRQIIFLSSGNFLLKLHYLEENISDEMFAFDQNEQESKFSQLVPGLLRVIRNAMSNLSLLPSMVDDYFSCADSIKFIEAVQAISSEKKTQVALIFTLTVINKLLRNLWQQSEKRLGEARGQYKNIILLEREASYFEKLTHFFADLQHEIGASFDEIKSNFIFILGADFLTYHEQIFLDGSCIKADGIESCNDTRFSLYKVKNSGFEAFFKTSVGMIGFIRLSEEMRKRLMEHQHSRAVIQCVVIANTTSHALKRLLIADYLRHWHTYQMQMTVFEPVEDVIDPVIEPQNTSPQVSEQEKQPVRSSFMRRQFRRLFFRPNTVTEEEILSDDSCDGDQATQLQMQVFQQALENLDCDGGGEYELVAMSHHASIPQYESFEPEKKSFYALVKQAYVNKITENSIENLVVHGRMSSGTVRGLQQLWKSERICFPSFGDEYSVLALRGLYYLLYLMSGTRFSQVLNGVVMKQWAIDLSEVKKIYDEKIFNSQEIVFEGVHIPEVLPILLALQAAMLVFYGKQFKMPDSEISEPYFSGRQMHYACQGNWFLKLRFMQEAMVVPSEQVFIIKLLKVIQNAFDHLLRLPDIIANFFDTTDSTEVRKTISVMPAYQRIKLALLMLVSFLYTTVRYLHTQVGAHHQAFDVTWLPKIADFFEEMMQEARFVYDESAQGTLFELVKMFLIAVREESQYIFLEGSSFVVQKREEGKKIEVCDRISRRAVHSLRPNMSSFYYYPGSIRFLESTKDRRADKGTKAFLKAVLENSVEDALMEAQIRHCSR